MGATGNASFGYFGGGQYWLLISTVDRIDYSNDTATAPVKRTIKCYIFLDHGTIGATGNASFGYFGGGRMIPAKSTVDRIDYSNDTATATAKGPLSAARYGSAASSAQQQMDFHRTTLFPASSSVRENVAPQGTDFGYFWWFLSCYINSRPC